jgi:hypothetical protein
MAEGVEGLARDKTRKPGKPPLPPDTVRRVVDQALGPPPGEATHWTGRMLAKAAGVSLRSVQRILAAHQLAPHRIRTFKLSNFLGRRTHPVTAALRRELSRQVIGFFLSLACGSRARAVLRLPRRMKAKDVPHDHGTAGDPRRLCQLARPPSEQFCSDRGRTSGHCTSKGRL